MSSRAVSETNLNILFQKIKENKIKKEEKREILIPSGFHKPRTVHLFFQFSPVHVGFSSFLPVLRTNGFGRLPEPELGLVHGLSDEPGGPVL